MRFLTGGRPTPRRTLADAHLPRFLHRHACTGMPGFWAAEQLSTGHFLGWLELRPLDGDPTSAELGYRLRRDAWGHGYPTEGARALLAMAFTEWGVRRVVATTMTVNAASRRVMEKVGLQYARTFFGDWPEVIAGSEYVEVEYELSRETWLRSSAAIRPPVDP
ncbi:GNAT family N-acetyltransferase [Geodermatophilus sp. DF01_2]|uniref:GNAT family N-acetyltransferase n=1 Tax=Geodermatophilus sp. DF01-2 TaxID=2559610 RepID=UPI001ADDC9E7